MAALGCAFAPQLWSQGLRGGYSLGEWVSSLFWEPLEAQLGIAASSLLLVL